METSQQVSGFSSDGREMTEELCSTDNENIGHGKRLPTTSWELRSFELLAWLFIDCLGWAAAQEENFAIQSLELP